jgi:hypothetical protein
MDFVIVELLLIIQYARQQSPDCAPAKSAPLKNYRPALCYEKFLDRSAPAASTGPQVFADNMQEQVHIDSGRNGNTKVSARHMQL